MPIYEYQCGKCGEEFEQLLMDRDEKVSCPACGATRPRKKLSVCAHKSDGGASPGSGSSCGGCTASSCSGCSGGH